MAPLIQQIDDPVKITNPHPVTRRPKSSDTMNAANMPDKAAAHFSVVITISMIEPLSP